MIRKPLTAALLAGAALLLPVSVQAQDAAPAVEAATTVDAAVLALAEVPRGKLTDAVKPVGYRIDTRFDPAQKGFTGSTAIDVELKKPSTFIDMHGRNLEFATIAARTAGGEAVAGTWHQLDDTGVARVTFPKELPAGKATLEFTYSGKYQDGASGLFHTEIDGKWYGWSQFESIDARAAFPSFDEPGFKVPFTVTIRNRPGDVAVSNAPEVSNKVEDGWQVHRFAPTLPLPTYLVAMMSGPFAVAESTVPPTPQRAEPLPLRIVTPHTNADKMTYALEESKPIVQLLEAYFGQAFPYPKLDQISSPLMGGAMENAGADLYADGILILDENAPISQKKTFGMVVAHELAHQWFGDLVTPAWWDDIWLNESFANWMGFTIGGQWKPDLGIGVGALGEGFGAMSTDTLLAGRPIHQAIETNEQIDAAFDSITYGKGGHVVSMIAAYMGPEKFQKGVQTYMAAHRYGNATSKDFFAAMAEAAGDPRITQAMQSFTDQQGVPLVTFAGSNGNYTITQSRYAPIGVTAPATQWGVPVCVRRGDVRNCTLLNDKSGTIAVGGAGALVPNAGGTGYYRFDLPAADWDALIASAGTLDTAEVYALGDSLGASFSAGHASTEQIVALAKQLIDSPDAKIASTPLGMLGQLSSLTFVSKAAQDHYRSWLDKLVQPKLAALGFDPKLGAYAGADPEVVQKRQLLVRLAAGAEDAAVNATLKKAAEAYLGGDKSALDPAYLGLALGVMVEDGGLPVAKQLAEAGLASQDPVFRPSALGAVVGSGKPEIAKWVLEEWNDQRLRPTEKLRGALSIVATRETRDYGFDWLVKNLDAINATSGGIFLVRAVPGVVSGFCTTEAADRVESLLGSKFAGTTGEMDFARSLERIRNCAALHDARAAEVEKALLAL